MKLLILTQKVDKNDDILGFFHGWIAALAKHCERIVVICLYKGEYDLPSNVTVLSLGKEVGVSRLKYLYRFYKYIFEYRNTYDSVYVHMNQIYVVLGGLLWKYWRKKIGLSYMHKQVSMSLRIAEKLVDVVYTSNEKGFNIPSKKVTVVGHGIDSSKFVLKGQHFDGVFRIVYIGRLSPIKNQMLLLKSLAFLDTSGIKVDFIGSGEGSEYEQSLRTYVAEQNIQDIVSFMGSVPNHKIPEVIATADLSLNLCPTGALDKAVIESMLGGALPLVLNESFRPHFENYANLLTVPQDDPKVLAEKITALRQLNLEERQKIQEHLKAYATEAFSIEKLVNKILIGLS